MKKHIPLLLISFLYLLLVSTVWWWQKNIGILAMLAFIAMALAFFVLVGILIYQCYLVVTEKFSNKSRLFTASFLAFVLVISLLSPERMVKSMISQSRAALVARSEGAANCTRTLVLNNDGNFTEQSICFGTSETTGSYYLSQDTIFFENIRLGRMENTFFMYAVIEQQDGRETLRRYINKQDTVGNPMRIVSNKLLPSPS